jgi:general secretion pathway protein D
LGNSINSITYTDVGIILKVTPYVTTDGLVQMIVAPQISSRSIDSTVQISANVNAPVIDIRSADTVVITPDGQTVVIGGLMKNDNSQSESKIPLLGDIPLLGNLFKRKTKTSDKNELLIFLTPYIVRSPGELAEMADREKARSWTHEPTTEKELERFLDKVPVKKDDIDDKKKKKKSQL